MGRFVISQTAENNAVVQTSHLLKFFKVFFFNEISPFGVDFEICNVDLFIPKHTHYKLTKIQKVKKHTRTPLIVSMVVVKFR